MPIQIFNLASTRNLDAYEEDEEEDDNEENV